MLKIWLWCQWCFVFWSGLKWITEAAKTIASELNPMYLISRVLMWHRWSVVFWSLSDRKPYFKTILASLIKSCHISGKIKRCNYIWNTKKYLSKIWDLTPQIKGLLKDYLVLKMIMICRDPFPELHGQCAQVSVIFAFVLYFSCNISNLNPGRITEPVSW